MDASPLSITPRVTIPVEELAFTASRSGGPGGQHVNKVSTRVTLLFDVDGSPSLADADRARIKAALGGRVGRDGVLRVVSQTTRSQTANKELAVERFVALLRAALTPLAPRIRTRATLASRRRRLDDKRRRAATKRERSRTPLSED